MTNNKQKNNGKNHEEKKTEEEIKQEATNNKELVQESKTEENKELTETEKLSMDLIKSYEKIDELTDTLQRLQAEFENFRKRTEKDAKRLSEYSSASVIGKILPIIDTFEIAIKNSDDEKKFKEGTVMIYNEIMSVLKSEGLKKIEALNKQFDPYLHEAMMAVEKKESEKDTIIEVLQEGYMLKDRVLRHSKVKISK